ncbi:MAG: Rpn family recombination-promoting nuclease/putative transposase [Clostridiales bacterium]|nr:Rpn family recombination-promoting nuclease/putative transposase [Clostridiales bacterium]
MTEQELDLERKRLEDLRRIQSLRLLDDDFMNKVFEDKACAEFLLQIILERTDLTVQKVHSQHNLKNLQGRSVRLDILATDEAGRVYNIEVQRSDKGAGAKRARYNSSLIDANITEPGDNYENLNETYVIFITEHDVLKAGQPIYHIDRMIQETSASFGDGSHILYVNAQIKDNTALGQLMHDFACTKAEEMHYPILAKRVRYFKEEQEGVATMSRIFEEIKREAAQEAARKTAREKSIQVARRMLMMGKYSYEEISAISDLTMDEVKALDEGKPA